MANKVALAQGYYALRDIPATCAVLAEFVNELHAQSGKKVNSQVDATLIVNADIITGENGLQAGMGQVIDNSIPPSGRLLSDGAGQSVDLGV